MKRELTFISKKDFNYYNLLFRVTELEETTEKYI